MSPLLMSHDALVTSIAWLPWLHHLAAVLPCYVTRLLQCFHINSFPGLDKQKFVKL